MWRERLEAFWDGGTSLLLGFRGGPASASFGTGEIASLIAPRYELIVTSCADGRFKSDVTLVDLIDVRTAGPRIWAVTLPNQHEHVSIRVRDGEELLLRLVPRESDVSGGELRLLMTELPAEGKENGFFRMAWVAANAAPARFADQEIQRSGERLVWALLHRRQIEYLARVPAAMHISPSRRVWPPRESAVTIQAVEPVASRTEIVRNVPFA